MQLASRLTHSAAVAPRVGCSSSSLTPAPAAAALCVHQQLVASPLLLSSPSGRHALRLPPLRAKKGGGKKGGKGGGASTSGGDDDDDDAGSSSSSSKKGGGKGGAAAGGAAGGDVDLDRVAKEAQADLEARMQKAVGVVADNFNTMRTGRANPAILDRVVVDYYGAPTPLKTLASIAVPDASTLVVQPFDKAALKDVEKAINEADIGINPSNDGERIRLAVPPMTQERRKELTKKVAKMGEEGKVAVRNVRKDILKKLDKVDFSKDARKGLEDAVQKTTDQYVKKVDDMVKTKSDDIMKV